MNELRKRPWVLPATIALTAALGFMLAILTREAMICASLGDWLGVRSYAVPALIPVAGLAFLWWGYAGIRLQRIDRHGVSALTLRSGRIVLPWSTVARARFERATALLEAGTIRVRIGFAMYSDYRAAEAFARARLAEAGAQVEG
jgi:hypothetical protein